MKLPAWIGMACLLISHATPAQTVDWTSAKAKYEAAKVQIETVLEKQKEENLAAYGNLLGSILAQLKQKGDLDAYVAVEKEQKRFDAEKSMPEKPEGEYVVKAVDAYRTAVAKLDAEKTAKMAAVQKAYVAQLDPLIRQLMQADKIEDAKRVKEELERVKFELAEVEAAAPKVEAVSANAEEETKISIGRKKVVLWNTHNGRFNDFGTTSCKVELLSGGKTVWEKKGIDVPWKAGANTSATIDVPAGIRFDKVRVEITKWQGLGGGLSEIQVFDGKRNIAERCKATASGFYQDRSGSYPPERVTDGNVSSEVWAQGYWLLPHGGQSGWVEVDLTKKTNAKDKGLRGQAVDNE